MKLSDALKLFKTYEVTFKKNDLNLYEIRNGNITIPSINNNESVFTSELKVGDMLGEETLIKFAEILEFKVNEVKSFT